MKKSTPILLLLLCSCGMQKSITLRTGTYTVDTVISQTVALKGVPGVYSISSDTLKPGDKITINVIKHKR